MNRKNTSPFDDDLRKSFKSDPKFAAAYLETLLEEPIPVQIALVRRLYGLSQEQIASRLKVKQSYISRLERKTSDSRFSTYQRVAKAVHGKFVFVPETARVVFS